MDGVNIVWSYAHGGTIMRRTLALTLSLGLLLAGGWYDRFVQRLGIGS